MLKNVNGFIVFTRTKYPSIIKLSDNLENRNGGNQDGNSKRKFYAGSESLGF